MRNLYRLICGAVLLTLTAACAGGRSGAGQLAATSGGRLPQGMSLSVLPATFQTGGRASISAQALAADDGSLTVEVRADDAQGLKGLFVQLSFDPAQWHPVGARASGVLATGSGVDPGELLEVSGETAAGQFQHGQILAHPDAQTGFSGSGVLATVHLLPGSSVATTKGLNVAFIPDQGVYLDPMIVSGSPRHLTWYYGSNGDYDQNGETNAADLIPLAQHLGESVGDLHGLLATVDGDGNQQITIADLTVIGRHFGETAEFDVYRSRDFSQGPLQFNRDLIPAVTYVKPSAPLYRAVHRSNFTGDPVHERLQCDVALDDELGDYYWVAVRGGKGALVGAAELASYNDVVFQHYLNDWNMAYDRAGKKLTHRPTLPGDFDGNGWVNHADLTPYGKYMRQVGPFLPGQQQFWVDANADGAIDGLDLSFYLRHWDQHLEHFNVYMTTDAAQVPIDLFAPSTLSPVGQDNGELDNFTPPSGAHVWIRPSYNGAEGPCSSPLLIP